MLTAKDLMTTDVVTIRKDAPVYEAIDLMLQHEISGLPVVEPDMTLVGIITEKDVLHLYHRTGRDQYPAVGDLMTTPVICFEQDETFEGICLCLLSNDFRRLPVTSANKVVGIISRPDITRRILETIRQDAVSSSRPRQEAP